VTAAGIDGDSVLRHNLDPADRAAFDAQLLADLDARRKATPASETLEKLALRHGARMRAARKRSGRAR
jgi:hypothetical protein